MIFRAGKKHRKINEGGTMNPNIIPFDSNIFFNRPMITKKHKITVLVITALLTFVVLHGIVPVMATAKPIPKPTASTRHTFTQTELSGYNGDDPSKPIYLAMDGLVYDVTPGKEYYQPGGDYHYLAGRDSSQELHIAGGVIIKRKYSVVGVLVP
jgi:predicted heme/steroid binding protein